MMRRHVCALTRPVLPLSSRVAAARRTFWINDSAKAAAAAAAGKAPEPVAPVETPAVPEPVAVPRVAIEDQQAAEVEGLASAAGSAFAGREVPTSTIFERMDNMWSSFFGTYFGLPHFGFVDSGVAWLNVAEQLTGVGWPAVMVGFGLGVRLAALYPTLYGERAALRLQAALPEIKPEFDAFQKVYYDAGASQREVQKVAEELKAARKRAYKRHGTGNFATLASVMASPLFLWGFSTAMRVVSETPALANVQLGWITSLAAPDPLMILPVVAVGLTVLNFELAFHKKKTAQNAGMSAYLPWVVRWGALCTLPVIVEFRAGVMLYWIGVSLMGLAQPALMWSKTFCRLFKVPEPPAHTAAVMAEMSKKTKKSVADAVEEDRAAQGADPLQGRIGSVMPRLAQVLRPGGLQELADEYKSYNSRQNEAAQVHKKWKSERR